MHIAYYNVEIILIFLHQKGKTTRTLRQLHGFKKRMLFADELSSLLGAIIRKENKHIKRRRSGRRSSEHSLQKQP